ncbi:MAG TPA: hypothetical protein VGV61_04325, partial [Thermoanaerobaculia bacterium]|nr:hypothetical protein [Thermoanaerobaculia bacterium]
LGIAGGGLGGALGLLAGRAVRIMLLGGTAPVNPALWPLLLLAGVLVALAGVAGPLVRTLRRPLALTLAGAA